MLFPKSSLLFESFLLATQTLALENPLYPRTIHQFPNPTWLENIASTRNGTILTGVLDATAALHLIDLFASPSNTSGIDTLLYTFPSADSVFGISELEPDVFAVATGNYSTTSGATEGSSSIWTVDLSPLCHGQKVSVRKVVDVKDAKVINGIAALNADTVLAADSLGGSIIRIDIKTGSYKILHNDISLAPNLTADIMLGVNGIKYVAPNLYYTNSQLGAFRVRVDPRSGAAIGPYTQLATIGTADDIAVTDDGTVFVARAIDNVVERVDRDGEVSIIAGGANNTTVSGATAITLGRTWKDRNVIYVCTFGGFAQDGEGFVEGGKVVALQIN
jgi:hypothetical protein